MKKIVFLISIQLSVFGFQFCHAQGGAIIVDTLITFDTKRQWVTIDTANHQNIWQIGRPKKIFFDSAYSRSNAIVTDTEGFYPTDNLSSFTIEVKKKGNPYTVDTTCWGLAKLSFWHKYDTDTLYDGGYIEIQYDSSNTWSNVIYDSPEIFNQSFYSKTDTILGNIPAFNGKSNGWVYSEFQWVWVDLDELFGWHYDVKIKFVFQSSSIKVNREGWMVDNINFTIYQCLVGINKLEMRNEEIGIKIYPNPVDGETTISYKLSAKSGVILAIYDMTGREVALLVDEVKDKGEYSLKYNAEGLRSGVYFVRMVSDNGVGVEKLIKN